MKSFLVRAALPRFARWLLPAASIRPRRSWPTRKPVLGPALNLQLYTLRDGHAHDPERTRFRWDGKRYAHAGGGMNDVASFTVHPFEGGDFIIQSVSAEHPEHVEYALMHTLAEGVY